MYFCIILFRTIKPNETKRPRDWEHQRVMHQVLSPNLLKNFLQQDKYFLSFRLNILDLKKTCGYEGRVLHTEDLLISLLKGQKLTKVSNSPKLIILLQDACILIFRYEILTEETSPRNRKPLQGTKAISHILKSVDMDSSQYQMGNTKIFIKDPASVSY